jgi:hypothetical protein
MLDGPKGAAVVRLDFSSAQEVRRLHEKAVLMALALSAKSCACAFGSVLEFAGGVALPVVCVMTETTGGGEVALFALHRVGERPSLRRLATRLACVRPPGALSKVLDGVLPVSPTQREVDLAWRRLKEMGVAIDTDERAIH